MRTGRGASRGPLPATVWLPASSASTPAPGAPGAGKQVLGIEVPNSVAGLVSLRNVIESPAFQRLKAKSKLALALGKSGAGEGVVTERGRKPPLLVAGA